MCLCFSPHLPVTDEETVQLMQTPRCSLPDDDDQTVQTSALHSDVLTQRMKRAASTWTRRNINWRLAWLFYQLFFFLIFHPAFTYLMVSTQYHSKEKDKKTPQQMYLILFFHRLRSYPGSSKLSREMIRSLVYYALRVWADPTLLEFHEVLLLFKSQCFWIHLSSCKFTDYVLNYFK